MPNENLAEAASTLKDRKVSNGMLLQSMASCGPKLQGNPPVNPDMEESAEASFAWAWLASQDNLLSVTVLEQIHRSTYTAGQSQVGEVQE